MATTTTTTDNDDAGGNGVGKDAAGDGRGGDGRGGGLLQERVAIIDCEMVDETGTNTDNTPVFWHMSLLLVRRRGT